MARRLLAVLLVSRLAGLPVQAESNPFTEQALATPALSSRVHPLVTLAKNFWGVLSAWGLVDNAGTLGDVDGARRKRAESIHIPRISEQADRDAVSLEAFERIAALIRHKSNARLLMPTGSTPEHLYRLLVQAVLSGSLKLNGVTILMLDEYFQGDDYADYIRFHFLDHLPLDMRPTVHVLNGMAPDPDIEQGRYEALVDENGGIDLAVLGVGPVHGHIAFNEGDTPFTSTTHVAKLSPETRAANRRWMKRDYTHAYTVGIATILRSREILVLAAGATKARPIAKLFEGKPREDYSLTSILHHANATLIADAEALGREPQAEPNIVAPDKTLMPVPSELIEPISRVVWVNGVGPLPFAPARTIAMRSAREVVELMPRFPDVWYAVMNDLEHVVIYLLDAPPPYSISANYFANEFVRDAILPHLVFGMELTVQPPFVNPVRVKPDRMAQYLAQKGAEEFSSMDWVNHQLAPWILSRDYRTRFSGKAELEPEFRKHGFVFFPGIGFVHQSPIPAAIRRAS